MRKFVIALALVASSFSSAMAASPKDVAEVVAMLSDLDVPMASRDTGSEMAFTYKGMRYTFYTPGDGPNKNGWLAVWVRPEHTHTKSSLDTFSDHGFSGVVDFGIDGAKLMYFNSGKDGTPVAGAQYAEYWQNEYDRAIKIALRYKHHYKK